jgi:TRIAD3 protein (E3 ubiquitin-protein ligase RNF216)
MDTGGCTAFFPDSELERLLPDKSLSLYHRLRQAKELELAAIEGLETCPACHYAEIMDNKEEKLFVCKNTECSQVSCRKCRQKVCLCESLRQQRS